MLFVVPSWLRLVCWVVFVVCGLRCVDRCGFLVVCCVLAVVWVVVYVLLFAVSCLLLVVVRVRVVVCC